MNKKEMEIENEPKTLIGGVVTMMPGRAWGVVLALAALTAMGLAFMWWCPDVTWFSDRMGEHWMFRRQAVWAGMGLTFAILVMMVGWRRWLKVAPFLALGWLAMFIVACLSPQVKHCLFVRIGYVIVDVQAWSPFVAALLLAWIAQKLAVRRVMGFLLAAVVVFSGALGVWSLRDREQQARVAAIFGYEAASEATPLDEAMLRQAAQEASCEATREARWFSGNREVLRRMSLPGRFTYSMPFTAALVFGKWFNVLVVALFGMFAVVLAWCFRRAENVGKKVFVTVAGGAFLLQAAYGYWACLGFMAPELRSCVPLVSYGGCVVIEWITAGILVALVRDDALEARRGRLVDAGSMPVAYRVR